jgi:Flp pilus assembly protein TadG
MTRFRRASDERGVAIVEFALIMPILILLVAGVIQFGIMYSQYQVFQGAAREGARCAAVQASDDEIGLPTCDVETEIDNASLGYELSERPSQNIICTDDTRGEDVTVSWNQALDTGVLGSLVPGVPDSINATISGTFRCE